MILSPRPAYNTLSFAAILDRAPDMDMHEDASLNQSDVSADEVPLTLHLDFDFDLEGRTHNHDVDVPDDDGDLAMRSPQSPTRPHKPLFSPNAQSPFDPSRFCMFPLDPPSSDESSPRSPRHLSVVESSRNLSDLHDASKENSPSLSLPPRRALPWIWTCHLCHSRYPLGATRRCLVDGHFYCSGDNSNQRNVKRRKKGQSCSSEFDYAGWQAWGNWKREALAFRQQDYARGWCMGSVPSLRGCEGCEYPSQCRHERLNANPDPVSRASKNVKSSDSNGAGTGRTSRTQTVSKKKRNNHSSNVEASSLLGNSDSRSQKGDNFSSPNGHLRSNSMQTDPGPGISARTEDRAISAHHRGGRREAETLETGESPSSEQMLVSPQLEISKSEESEASNIIRGLRQKRISDFFRIRK